MFPVHCPECGDVHTHEDYRIEQSDANYLIESIERALDVRGGLTIQVGETLAGLLEDSMQMLKVASTYGFKK